MIANKIYKITKNGPTINVLIRLNNRVRIIYTTKLSSENNLISSTIPSLALPLSPLIETSRTHFTTIALHLKPLNLKLSRPWELVGGGRNPKINWVVKRLMKKFMFDTLNPDS